MPQHHPSQYPLSAVVAADDLVLALILAAVAPDVGGVLVRGEKGTAKTTAVRALAVLPPIEVIAGGPVLVRPARERRPAGGGPARAAASAAPRGIEW
jgi:magnesium chelatase subunit D